MHQCHCFIISVGDRSNMQAGYSIPHTWSSSLSFFHVQLIDVTEKDAPPTMILSDFSLWSSFAAPKSRNECYLTNKVSSRQNSLCSYNNQKLTTSIISRGLREQSLKAYHQQTPISLPPPRTLPMQMPSQTSAVIHKQCSCKECDS